MANEITIIEIKGARTDAKRADVLFLYDVAAPVALPSGNIAPTPSDGLSAIASQILTAAEKTNLDNGDKVFEVIDYNVDDSMTPGQIAADPKSIYATRSADFTNIYSRRFARTGTRINA